MPVIQPSLHAALPRGLEYVHAHAIDVKTRILAKNGEYSQEYMCKNGLFNETEHVYTCADVQTQFLLKLRKYVCMCEFRLRLILSTCPLAYACLSFVRVSNAPKILCCSVKNPLWETGLCKYRKLTRFS